MEDTASNQGFSGQQKQELRQIVTEVVETVTEPKFTAIQADLLQLRETDEKIIADLRTFKEETGRNFDDATEHRDTLARKQVAQQTVLDTHDRILSGKRS